MLASRIGRAAGLVAVAALLAPGAASAHLRTGTVAVRYRAAVTSAPDAVSVHVYASDLGIGLTVSPRHRVVVLGYLGEPFLRLGPAGVSVNTSSPTAAAAGLLGKQPPGRGWQLRAGATSAVWHDTRVSQLRPGAGAAAWRIPLLVDGRRTGVAGTTRRIPPPALWPWLVLLAAGALAAAALARIRGAERSALALSAVAAAAAVVLALAFALDSYASPGTWIESLDELAFVAAGVVLVVWGPPRLRTGAAVGLGLLGLAVGLSKGAVFLDGGVLAVLPGTEVRALAAAAIAAGAAAGAIGGAALASGSGAEPVPAARSSFDPR